MSLAAVERLGLRHCQGVAREKFAAKALEGDGSILVTTNGIMRPTAGAT